MTWSIINSNLNLEAKYAFLGSLRSTAAMVSYELILSSAILIVIILSGSFNFTSIIESQQAVWYIVPLLPVFIFFFISILAETSRTPFDLQEAESELVAGFFTEHSSVIFVFFFLAEYASIVLICILNSILFLGGYLLDYTLLSVVLQDTYMAYVLESYISPFSTPVLEGLIYGLTLGLKTCIMIFVFIWARASLPRIRFDQLMSFCWTVLLPIVVAFIILVPCILYGFDILPNSILL